MSNPGGHAVETIGWGHDKNGRGYWIAKNSWGCTWGDSGYFRQSWSFNTESYMYGIEMDLTAGFTSDVPSNYQNSCVAPADSDRSDHCREGQINEFGKCKNCNTGYSPNNDGVCVLATELISDNDSYDNDDWFWEENKPSDSVVWTECVSGGVAGWQCLGGDSTNCWTLNSGKSVDCATWLSYVEYWGGHEEALGVRCTACPGAPENCKVADGNKCTECN